MCPARKWTIGYGSTTHPDGRKVKKGDTITQEQAEEYLKHEVKTRLKQMQLPLLLTKNMKTALVDLQYNIGHGNFRKSTLRRKMMKNHLDPSIRNEFMQWVCIRNKAGRLVSNKGLIARRKRDADLYFK